MGKVNSSQALFKELDLPLGEVFALRVVFDLKAGKDKYYHAMLVAEDMVKLCSIANDAESEAVANLLAADLQVKQGDLQSAMDKASNATELFDQVGNVRK